MTTTIMIILLILIFFVVLFYYTHREDEETDSLLGSKSNERTSPTPLNQTAKTVLTDTWNGVNGLRTQVSQTLSEMNLNDLPRLPKNGVDLKSLKIWPNGKATNGTEPLEMKNGHANEHKEANSEGEHIPLAHRVTDALNGWNPLVKPDNQLSERFTAWADNTHFANRVKRLRESTRAMKSWLTSLESEESEILAKQVSDFASDLNFELGWLLDKKLEDHAELKRDMEEVIVLYCLATFKGLLLQDELNTFIMFQAWLEDPTRKEYQELNQQLFTILVERELAQPVPPELLLADEQQRSEYAIQAINRVLQADRKTFVIILKEVLLAAESETEQSEPIEPAEKPEESKQPSLA